MTCLPCNVVEEVMTEEITIMQFRCFSGSPTFSTNTNIRVVQNQIHLGLFTTDGILDSFLKISYTKGFCLENPSRFCFQLYHLFSVCDI